jgi:hypothetical protein
MKSTIILCGDRNWNDFKEISSFLDYILLEYRPEDVTVVHGDCKGADKIGGWLAHSKGMNVIPCPADWDKYGLAAGPIRNQFMLDKYHPDLVVGFHNNYNKSKGTKDMLTRAKKANIYTLLVSSEKVITIHDKVFKDEEILEQKKLC